MPITPYDMLTLLPRVNEVSHIKQVEMERPTQEQMQMNAAFQQKTEEKKRKTIHSEKSNNAEYRYDAKEKKQNGQQYESKGKKKIKKNTDLNEFKKTGSFDIKI